MTKYTVLLLRPEDMWAGHSSDWVLRQHVEAESVESAFGAAQDAAKAFDDHDCEPEAYAVLAVYEGHLIDRFVA